MKEIAKGEEKYMVCPKCGNTVKAEEPPARKETIPEKKKEKLLKKRINLVKKFLKSDMEQAKVSGKLPPEKIHSTVKEAINKLKVKDKVEVLKKNKNIYLKKK